MKIYGHAMRRSDLYLFVLARNKAEAMEKVIAIEKDYCHTFGQTFQEPDKHYVYFVSYAEYKSYHSRRKTPSFSYGDIRRKKTCENPF